MKQWILLILILGIFACNKDENNTKLELTILDENGNPAKDFKVRLYGNFDSWNYDDLYLKSERTNDKGIVTFENLNIIKYFFRASKGCQNNNLGYVSIDPIKTDTTTRFTLQVQETCHCTVSNVTNNKYEIYFNDVSKFIISGNSSKELYYAFPIGTTKVRALQLDGFISIPTDLTFIVDGECGSVEYVTIR